MLCSIVERGIESLNEKIEKLIVGYCNKLNHYEQIMLSHNQCTLFQYRLIILVTIIKVSK